MRQVLYKLCEMVGARLRANELMGNIVHVFVYNPDTGGGGGSANIGYYSQDGRDIYIECIALLTKQFGSIGNVESKNYLIGVTVSGLVPYVAQPSLFDSFNKAGRQQNVMAALDKINQKYEDFTIARVPAFLARDIIRDSVGFGRMKEFKTTFMGGSRGKFG